MRRRTRAIKTRIHRWKIWMCTQKGNSSEIPACLLALWAINSYQPFHLIYGIFPSDKKSWEVNGKPLTVRIEPIQFFSLRKFHVNVVLNEQVLEYSPEKNKYKRLFIRSNRKSFYYEGLRLYSRQSQERLFQSVEYNTIVLWIQNV